MAVEFRMILDQGNEQREDACFRKVDEEVDADEAPLEALEIGRCYHLLFLRLLPVQKQENGGHHEEGQPVVLGYRREEGHVRL